MAQLLQNASAQSPQSSQTYSFPQQRLRRACSDSTRIPLVLVACGSFSPITYLHLRMFTMASDFAKFNDTFEIMGGYLSPVSDLYEKQGMYAVQFILWLLLMGLLCMQEEGRLGVFCYMVVD
jgi:hypothetical protein